MAYEGCPDNAVHELARDLTHKHALVAKGLISLAHSERTLHEASKARVDAEVSVRELINELPEQQRSQYWDEINAYSGIGPKALRRREDYSDCID